MDNAQPKKKTRWWPPLLIGIVLAYLLTAAGPKGLRIPGLRAASNLQNIKSFVERETSVDADTIRSIVATQIWTPYAVQVVGQGREWSVVATPPQETRRTRVMRAVFEWDLRPNMDPTRVLLSSNLTILSKFPSGQVYVH